MIVITSLTIYPVKSLRGISLDSTRVGITGLAFDRHWMITDSDYHFLTQRQIPLFATVQVDLDSKNLILSHAAHPPLVLDHTRSQAADVDAVIWKDRCRVIDQGETASRWITAVAGKWKGNPLKLVRFPQNEKRWVDPNYQKGESATTAFADGFPYLLTSESSLAALNTQLSSGGASPVTMDRFRPNIVINGLPPFVEDRLESIEAHSGGYRLGIRKPCQRCKITTVDQHTGVISDPREPLKTLARINTLPGISGAFFGQNATLLSGNGATISIGDRLRAARAENPD